MVSTRWRSIDVKPPRKPRLLWANPFCLLDTCNGAAMVVREMLRQLVAHGYEVEVLGATIFDHERGTLLLQPQWAHVQACLGGVVTVEDPPLVHRLLVTAKIERKQMTAHEEGNWFNMYETVLTEFKPDVIFYYGSLVLERMIAAEAKARAIPCAVLMSDGSYAGKNWCRDVDLMLVLTQSDVRMYARTQGYQAVSVGAFVNPRGVVAARHTRERVLFINPSRAKGVGILVQLALLLEKRRPDIVFEVVESRGSWRPMLSQVSQALGSPRQTLSNVVVTANTADMRPLFGRARLLFAPSLWWESAGRVAAEAMLNGIPAIVTERGGLPEMVGDGGVKIQLPDACYQAPYTELPAATLFEPLIALVIRFYDDPQFYAHYSARAFKVGQTVHNLESQARRLLDALAPLAARRAGDQVRNAGEPAPLLPTSA